MDYPDQGYPEGRFSSDVDDDLLCAICLNVLREPLQCVKNEHHFCAPCIKRHLNSTPKCPSCMEDLSVRTLRKPARYLTKHLSSLQIKCDYEGRGCRELIKFDQLRHHVEGCGYAPVRVLCNGCKQMMNTSDMMQHECPAKAPNCHGCTSIKKQVDELKETVNGVQEELQVLPMVLQANINRNDESLKNEIGELKVAFHNLAELVRNEVRERKCDLEKFKENQATGISRPVCVAEPLEDAIVVIGGYNGRKRLTSVEMYVWSKQKWVPFPSTNLPRSGSSAVVHQNKILVTGGRVDDKTLTDSIEAIKIVDGRPGLWYENPYSLPAAAIVHCCFVYEECLYLVGGCKHNSWTVSDDISCIPICVESPAAQWILKSKMFEPRCFHGIELFGDNMVVIGGVSEYKLGHRASSFEPSVLSMNLKTDTLLEISELHSCIFGMATVPWGDHIILLGGENASGDPLNTAKMYNIKTGKIYQLPPMKYKRWRCTAVILNNSIVVMGGHNGEYLNTVECFSFAIYTWSELPPMRESRSSPTSVVVPIKASEIL